jgi:hypothetical protein
MSTLYKGLYKQWQAMALIDKIESRFYAKIRLPFYQLSHILTQALRARIRL